MKCTEVQVHVRSTQAKLLDNNHVWLKLRIIWTIFFQKKVGGRGLGLIQVGALHKPGYEIYLV